MTLRVVEKPDLSHDKLGAHCQVLYAGEPAYKCIMPEHEDNVHYVCVHTFNKLTQEPEKIWLSWTSPS